MSLSISKAALQKLRLSEALKLAALGWPLLPLQNGGKAPAGQLVSRGRLEATTDPQQLARWADAAPFVLNWAISPPVNVLVLDVDGTPPAELKNLVPRANMQVKTPNGGFHIYLSVPTGWAESTPARVKLVPGLDLRGLGRAYLVCPPSALAGRADWYRWAPRPVAIDELEPASPELLEWITEKLKPAVGTSSSSVLPMRSTPTAAGGWLAAVVERVGSTPPGSRHQALLAASRAAGGYVAAGRLEADVAHGALVAAGLRCGLPERECLEAVGWGLAAGAEQPIWADSREATSRWANKPSWEQDTGSGWSSEPSWERKGGKHGSR